VKPTDDGKSNVICITSIATADGKIVEIPLESQPVGLHKEITNTSNYAKVRKSLTKRHQIRRIWITVTEDMSKIYLDEDKNLQFNDIYLEENTEKTQIVEPSSSGSNQSLEKLLEKLLENKQPKSETQNLGTIAKDFMIDKFNDRSSNAKQWMDIFNKEYRRFEINEDKKKI